MGSPVQAIFAILIFLPATGTIHTTGLSKASAIAETPCCIAEREGPNAITAYGAAHRKQGPAAGNRITATKSTGVASLKRRNERRREEGF